MQTLYLPSVRSLSHKLLGKFLGPFAVWSVFLATFAIWSNFLGIQGPLILFKPFHVSL